MTYMLTSCYVIIVFGFIIINIFAINYNFMIMTGKSIVIQRGCDPKSRGSVLIFLKRHCISELSYRLPNSGVKKC